MLWVVQTCIDRPKEFADNRPDFTEARTGYRFLKAERDKMKFPYKQLLYIVIGLWLLVVAWFCLIRDSGIFKEPY